MVRKACAWALLLLAASPFTAPFSTCDVSMLMRDLPHEGHAPYAQVESVAQQSPDAEVSPVTSEAYAISPVSTRLELGKQLARASFALLERVVAVKQVRTGRVRPHGCLNHTPDRPAGKSVILRL